MHVMLEIECSFLFERGQLFCVIAVFVRLMERQNDDFSVYSTVPIHYLEVHR